MKPDLTLLYSQVDLNPGCSLEELQLAYRRRISELQPDHNDPRPQSPENSVLLRDLIYLYATAGRFHRRYGRLPGAGQHRPMVATWPSAKMQPANSRYRQAPQRSRQAQQVAHGFFLLLVLVLLGVLVWWDWRYW